MPKMIMGRLRSANSKSHMADVRHILTMRTQASLPQIFITSADVVPEEDDAAINSNLLSPTSLSEGVKAYENACDQLESTDVI